MKIRYLTFSTHVDASQALPTAASLTQAAQPKADQNFYDQAAVGTLFGRAASELAARRCVSSELRGFAQISVQDYASAHMRMTALARRKNVALPTVLDSRHGELLAELTEVSDEAFEQRYIEKMAIWHDWMLALFKDAVLKAADIEVRSLAAGILAGLRQRKNIVQQLSRPDIAA